MDFWSRLIAGTALSPSNASKAAANNPERRLARFRREYNQILQVWRNASNLARDNDAAERIRAGIQSLISILSDETRRPSPHMCLTFAATKQVYVSIGKIATTSHNEPIIRETVGFFSSLIDSEEEDFIESEEFSNSLMNLMVRITGANSIRLGHETEVEVVELAFGIAAKIRLQPEILPAWFTTDTDRSIVSLDEHAKFTGRTHKEDFPLFYLLIDYIHHEGRIGDFARTGLLYIIESASTSMALEQWVVESDLATLMATGLGALYSQLSRKLVIDYPPNELPPTLALSDYRHPQTSAEIESSASPEFLSHMETFLSHLVFWQDVLEHCKSIEVKQTLLEHFQVIFLQQLLYPSLLESSDIDGGSSVAVLTYLRRILESLDHPDMIQRILHYLLALPDTTAVKSPSRNVSISAARKRKSMDLATMLASKVEPPSGPELFNLVDLVLGSLKSKNQQTIAVTLQLLSVILRRHHCYAIPTLLRTSNIIHDEPQRTIGAHEKELDFYLSLAGEISSDEHFNNSYENLVKDCTARLEGHPCSMLLIAPNTVGGTFKLPGTASTIPGAPREVHPHTIRPDDPILRNLTGVLDTFFTNSVEANLCLTETIVDLAACGQMHIEGWLVPDPTTYAYTDEDRDDTSAASNTETDSSYPSEELQLHALRLARRQPIWPATVALPLILQHLQMLTHEVSLYRADIPRFDDLLAQRRSAFRTAHDLSAAMEATPVPIRNRRNDDSQRASLESSIPSRSTSPQPVPTSPRTSAFDSLAQRIFPELASTPSRSTSPRGRRNRDPNRSSGTTGGLGSDYGFSTPTSTASRSQSNATIAPPRFLIGAQSPTNTRAFSPSPLRDGKGAATVSGSFTDTFDVSAGQAAAFAAIDQTILSRRVGMPSKKAVAETGIPFPDPKKNIEFSERQDLELGKVGGSTRVSSVAERTEESGSLTGSESISTAATRSDAKGEKTVTVSHVLTNVIVLQEFLLEIAALIQVRAGLFGEIKFL